jgi:CheY-like chemotaxis protein
VALTSLLVCSDVQTGQVLSQILHEMGIRVESCGDSQAARARLDEQQFDTLLVDCQDEPAAVDLIAYARKTLANKTTVTIALANAGSQVRHVFASGVSFVLYKPISRERAGHSLEAARALMLREKRRQPRVPVQTQASLTYATIEDAPATLLDLNESGVAIQADQQLPPSCKVYFQFALPGNDSVIRLSGEVMWQDSSRRVGIRFAHVPQVSQRALKGWLQAQLPAHAEAGAADAESPEQVPDEASTQTAEGLGSDEASDRRIQSRHACRLGAEVYREGSSVPQRCNLSDISAEGCYVETAEPFPPGTTLEMVVHTQYLKLRVHGRVCSMHRGFGMGVRFTLRTADQRQQVHQLIACEALDSESPVEPT